jgi:putative ABC transport system ATP-binding protein
MVSPPSGAAGPPVVAAERIGKRYRTGAVEVAALVDVSFTVGAGEFVAVMGPSGSGKSTLMNILGCLDRPTSGRLAIDGADVAGLDADALAMLRRKTVGFVFQSFNLMPRLSARDNVAMPTVYAGLPVRERKRRAEALLAAVGLAERGHHRPTELSGGQKQRVAIARALVNDPKLILADEPTGALDSRTGLEILALLQRLNRDDGRTVVLVTHDREIARHAGRVLRFHDGRLVADERTAAPLDARTELQALPPPVEAAA